MTENTELKPNIHWVGVVDWNVRDFHSYDTPRGATYNSYLICDEKTVLIDTVKAPFAAELLFNIASLTELDTVDYVVCNHAELDHSGALPTVMRALPNATLLCNAKCKDVLATFFDISNWKIQVVDGQTSLSLGSRTLKFLDTPMVHWPESMFTYVPEEAILFSMDGFGQHLATSVRFDDQWPLTHILQEAKTYFANIVTPYGRQVMKTLEVAATMDIKMIAPSHGLIWRKHIGDIVECYQNWANGVFQNKVIVLYDTMWEGTARMADAIIFGAQSVAGDLDVQPIHVRKVSLTRIATEMLDSPAVAIGSATLNGQMMPQMSAVLTYIKGLKFRAKSTFAFGASGWGPGGPDSIAKWFEEVRWSPVAEMLRVRNRPTSEQLEQCRQIGAKLGEMAVKSSVKSLL